jgi:hypothetical protein
VQGLQGRFGGQPRLGQARAKRRVLLRMRLGKLTKGLSHLRMLLFPSFAATQGRLRPATDDPSAFLCQAQGHGLAALPEDGCCLQGRALTLFHRHLGLKGAPRGPGHLRGREADIGNLRRRERWLARPHSVGLAHESTSRIESAFIFLEDQMPRSRFP